MVVANCCQLFYNTSIKHTFYQSVDHQLHVWWFGINFSSDSQTWFAHVFGYLLVAEGPPYAIPTFQAHKVELVTPSRHRKFYRAVDSTGDALVIEVTNNEKFPIHICVISYQADGSIVVLYPPKKASSLVIFLCRRHFLWACHWVRGEGKAEGKQGRGEWGDARGGVIFGRQSAFEKLWFWVQMWTRKLALICLMNSISSEGVGGGGFRDPHQKGWIEPLKETNLAWLELYSTPERYHWMEMTALFIISLTATEKDTLMAKISGILSWTTEVRPLSKTRQGSPAFSYGSPSPPLPPLQSHNESIFDKDELCESLQFGVHM